MNITEYIESTGELRMMLSFPDVETYEINVQDGFGYIEGHYDGADYYLVDGQPTERPASPVNLSDLTLQGVPAGSTLFINGERYENVEGNVELEFPLAGVYMLRVECWPYKDWAGEVVVP